MQSLLTEFNKEQEAFIKAKGGKGGEALPPWVGYPEEEKLKEEILSLSTVSILNFIQFIKNFTLSNIYKINIFLCTICNFY